MMVLAKRMRSSDVKDVPSSSNIMNVKTNAASGLANHSTVLQCIVNPLDTVCLHRDEEA